MTRFLIISRETNEVTHTIECTKTGSQLDKVRMGLERKVDSERFYVKEETEK